MAFNIPCKFFLKTFLGLTLYSQFLPRENEGTPLLSCLVMAAGSMKVFLEVSSDRPSQVTYFKSTTKKYHTGHFLLRYTTG